MSEINDAVNPSYYRSEGNVHLIELIRLMPFSIGNAIKYVYRNENKAHSREDLTKALWYLNDYAMHPVAMDEPISATLIASVLHGCQPWERRAVVSLVNVYSATQLQWSSHHGGEAVERAREMLKNRIDTLE